RQVADRERRLRAEVRMKAGELLAAQRNLSVTDDLLRVNREGLSVVGNRVREGAAPSLDESLQLVEVNRLDAGRQLAQSRVAIARAEAATASAMVKKEQAEARWDASINVGYQRQDFGFNLNGVTSSGATRPIQDVFHYFGGGISVMLPVRNRNEGNIAAAMAGVRAAERRVEFTVLTVQQEVAAAFAQYEAARRSVDLYERGVRDVARRNLDVVRQAYRLGRG